MKIVKKYNTNRYTDILYIFKGIFFGYLLTLICYFILGGIIYFTNFSEKIIPIVTTIVSIISIAIAGFYVSSNTKSKGWLKGGIVGLLYILILLAIGRFIIPNYALSSQSLIKLIIGFVIGSIGGIIGVSI
ncbi:MAG TPA: TIGR04086 family membrane protein [Thermoanaerobacterales bacterium]|nr:TIGR04086 family membrane protein [Thermoanaerobacterales bacterium]